MANRYRLLDQLGVGGMSVVWRAHDEVLDREVAVKVLSHETAADPMLLDRIRIEARAAARLRHPHVVEVHDFGETEAGLPFVVMELVDGRSLADLLVKGPLPWRSAVTIGAQVADALSAAHARGIVHRDVKPSNVMVTQEGVKLVDFGISASAGEADGIGGEVYGTPAYLAPERISGGVVRPATDVYALGLLLYLMLAGRLPWAASTTTQMLRAHVYADPAGLPPVPGLPHDVAALVRRCLSKRPGDRPTALAVAGQLADAAGLVLPPSLLAAIDQPTKVIRFHPIRRRGALLAGAAAVTVALAGVGFVALRDDSPPVTRAAAAPPAAAAAAPTCTVGYAIRSAVNGRYSTAVTLAHTATPASWRLTFELPAGQKLVKGWTGGWAQEGRSLRLSGTGRKVSTGFDASYSRSATLPGAFTLNGTVCEAEMSVGGQTRTTTTTRPATHPFKATAPKPPKPPEPAKKAPKPKEKNDNSGPGSNSGKGKGKG
ncbi:serine/threonine-protein kinase [Actinoplanes sp. NPDC051633]|uniref:serine/threonine-protein kinase n=1 Tax=Actinoplanes sp. NPDC051633 TaxID=3155670 RepID=UPI003449E5CE